MDESAVAVDTKQAEADARLLGWIPKNEFRGDPAKWKPADEFLQLSESQLPLARAANKALKETNAQLLARLQETQIQITGMQEAIESLKEFHSEDTKRKVEQARARLLSELKKAREAGDMDTETEILDALTKAQNEAPAAKTKPAASSPPAAPALDPEFVRWKGDNAWFEQDKRKRGVAVGIAEELRTNPAYNNIRGYAFFDEVKRQTEEYLGQRQTTQRQDKTEGGGNAGAGGGGGGGTKAKGFAQLPADAKAVCDAQQKKFVGKGFKDLEAWRAYYAKTYWEAEDA